MGPDFFDDIIMTQLIFLQIPVGVQDEEREELLASRDPDAAGLEGSVCKFSVIFQTRRRENLKKILLGNSRDLR